MPFHCVMNKACRGVDDGDEWGEGIADSDLEGERDREGEKTEGDRARWRERRGDRSEVGSQNAACG
jgi:hypothetical protein